MPNEPPRVFLNATAFFMAMLKPLGIEKGKAFKPDARQRAILEEAANVGDAMAR